MKKENPLSMAVASRVKQGDISRFVTLKSSEVPRGTNVKDSVTVEMTGIVDSINAKGEVVLKISNVGGGEKDDEKETETPKVLRVVTQESHAGG